MNSWQQPVSGEPSVGTLHSINPTKIVYNTNPAETTDISVDCSSYVPSGTKGLLLDVYYLRASGYMIIYFADSGTPSVTNHNDLILDYGSSTFISRHVFVKLSSESFVFNVDSGTCDSLYLRIIGYYI